MKKKNKKKKSHFIQKKGNLHLTTASNKIIEPIFVIANVELSKCTKFDFDVNTIKSIVMKF